MKIEMYEKTNRAFVTNEDGTKMSMLYGSAEMLYKSLNEQPCIRFHKVEQHGLSKREVVEVQYNTTRITKYSKEMNF